MGRDNPTATAAKLFSLGLTLNFVARMLSEKDEDEDDGRTYHDDRGNVKNSTSMSLPLDIFFENKQGRHLDLPIDFALSPIWGLSELAAKHMYHANNEKYSPDLIEDLWDYFKVSLMGIAPLPSSINMFPRQILLLKLCPTRITLRAVRYMMRALSIIRLHLHSP